MTEPLRIRTLDQLSMVIGSGGGLVITDVASGAVFHPDPAGCPHVQESFFQTKVMVNRSKNGDYYAIGSFDDARARWPGVMACRSGPCRAVGEAPSVGGEADILATVLSKATGSDTVRQRTEPPHGAEALMGEWESTQRIALGDRDGQLLLCTWPGELLAQARAFYGSDRAERVSALMDADPNWLAVPRPHLAYQGARRTARFYFRCSLSATEYLARWSRPEDLKEVGGHPPESVRGELWQWLGERGYADLTDPDAEEQLERYMANLERRRSHAHLRPSIELTRRCTAVDEDSSRLRAEVTDLVREIAETLREPLA